MRSSNSTPIEINGQNAPMAPIAEIDHLDPNEDRASRFGIKPHGTIDVKAFRVAWTHLRNCADFLNLIEHYDVSEREALFLAGDVWATQISITALIDRLQLLARLGLPCTLSVAGCGAMQTDKCVIEWVQSEQGSVKLFTTAVELVIRAERIESAWVVTKPKANHSGVSLELYDRAGCAIMRVLGPMGHTENAVWQDIVGTLALWTR